MHKINALIFFFLLLFILGCEDKKTSNEIYMENTTEVLGHPNNNPLITSHTDNIQLSDTFKLSNMQDKHYTVTVSNKKVTFRESEKAIILITFFATWCPPCVHNIPYMNDLDKKYKNKLLLTGILIHDTMPKDKLQSFLSKHDVKYFISNSRYNNDFASLIAKTLQLPKDFSIPLTVMYVEGKYFTHYEGIVPVEMVEYDIQEALKTLK